MAKVKAMGTGRIPLAFAAAVSEAANASFGDGRGPMMAAVTPVTRALLKFWFTEPFTARELNFHAGQRQAILNVVYLHEVVRAGSPRAAYAAVAEGLLAEGGGAVAAELAKPKYGYPKHLVKMATGTGKTWVMHALLVWQYLNAKFETGERSGLWTKNFLFVAPGLIVYERLLDAFCGRRVAGAAGGAGGEARDFATSDLKAAESLFVPPEYRDAVFAFVQNGVVRKEDFGRKVTGDGVLAVMNWHGFLGDDETEDGKGECADADACGAEDGEGSADGAADGGAAEGDDPDGRRILDDLLPAKPGLTAGNALEALDAQYLRGGRLDFLKELPDLMLVNDEAHHVHGGAAAEEDAAKWQRGIDLLAEGKASFFQLDFSATPYEPTGSGRNAREDFFPHVVVDYDLKDAIRDGRVKTIVIDRRKDLDSLAELDYGAVREGKRIVGLSEGQRVMLRAGLKKLDYLEREFARFDAARRPKMMVVCEETAVTPFVEEFLRGEGLAADDVLTVHSDRRGEVGEKEWAALKGRLFALDRGPKPRVVVSVLMLREGFDVNSICVIVPLRATKAPILLEQTLGRGLRLMWREPEYREEKDRSRRQVLVERVAPDAVLDFLYVVEHPAFVDFYERFLEEGLAGTGRWDDREGAGGGDLVVATLKGGYERYDLFWPVVLRESEDVLSGDRIDAERLKPYSAYTLEHLRRLFAKEGETFVGQEMLVKTRFGEYRVHANLFDAASYNEYLQGVVNAVFRRFARVGGKQARALPALQVNLAEVAAVVDGYVREGLFGEPFDPLAGNDWKILLCLNGHVTQHVVRQVGELVWAIETGTVKTAAEVRKAWFSSVPRLVVREGASLALRKTIYTRTGHPSHGGGLERAFLEFVDRDAQVERFVKVSEARHVFARIAYLRADGLVGEYVPDFLVATAEGVWVVETKAADRTDDENVRQKRTAALEWCRQVNALAPDDRLARTWRYLLVSEADFYAYRDAGGTFADLCAFAEVTGAGLRGEFDFGTA